MDKKSVLLDEKHPTMDVLDINRCEVRPIDYKTAKFLVEKYHYAHRVPSIVFSVGLFVDNILAGCVTYGIPPVPNVQRICGEENRRKTLELNRLFIFDWCGKNSESYLISKSFWWLEKEKNQYKILVSYADNKEGHFGYVYQATNWIYTGKSPAMNVGYVINGHEYHNKALVNMIGSWSKKVVLEKFPNAKQIKGGEKERYVFF